MNRVYSTILLLHEGTADVQVISHPFQRENFTGKEQEAIKHLVEWAESDGVTPEDCQCLRIRKHGPDIGYNIAHVWGFPITRLLEYDTWHNGARATLGFMVYDL